MTEKKHRIDCRKCSRYYVTWNPARPHGCRAMGFKSVRIPNSVVYRNSGADCQAFKPKTLKKNDKAV